jgi:hypothetical protein
MMRVKTALQFTVATAIPLIAFALINERYLRVGARFLLHELDAHRVPMVLLAATAGLIALALWVFRRRAGYVFMFLHALRRLPGYRSLSPLVVAVLIAAMLLPYLYARYRLFSEVTHQTAALEALEAGDVQSAAQTCVYYLTLYPQRRADGTIPDPVCVPLLTFTQKMARLSDYVRAQQPVTANIGRVWVSAAPDARAQALRILDAWAGRTPSPLATTLSAGGEE